MNNKHLREAVGAIRALDDKIATAQAIMKAAQDERAAATRTLTDAFKHEMRALLSEMNDCATANKLSVESLSVNAQSADVFVLCFNKVHDFDGNAVKYGSLGGEEALALNAIASAMKERLEKASIACTSLYVTVPECFWNPAIRASEPLYN